MGYKVKLTCGRCNVDFIARSDKAKDVDQEFIGYTKR